MKKVEADGLLDLHGAALCPVFRDIPDPDVAAAPEIVQILLLRSEQLLKALVYYTIRRPFCAAAEFFRRSRRRRVVDHVFGEMDRTIGPSVDCEGNLAEVLGVCSLV